MEVKVARAHLSFTTDETNDFWKKGKTKKATDDFRLLIPGGLVLFAAVCDSHTVVCQDTTRTSDAKNTASYANKTQ